MSASKSPLSEQARDLFEGMTWELEYLIRQFDPSGKDSDWNDARRLVEKARREANKMVEDQSSGSAKSNERWAKLQSGIRITWTPTAGWVAEIRDGSTGYGDTIAGAIENLRERWEEKAKETNP